MTHLAGCQRCRCSTQNIHNLFLYDPQGEPHVHAHMRTHAHAHMCTHACARTHAQSSCSQHIESRSRISQSPSRQAAAGGRRLWPGCGSRGKPADRQVLLIPPGLTPTPPAAPPLPPLRLPPRPPPHPGMVQMGWGRSLPVSAGRCSCQNSVCSCCRLSEATNTAASLQSSAQQPHCPTAIEPRGRHLQLYLLAPQDAYEPVMAVCRDVATPPIKVWTRACVRAWRQHTRPPPSHHSAPCKPAVPNNPPPSPLLWSGGVRGLQAEQPTPARSHGQAGGAGHPG